MVERCTTTIAGAPLTQTLRDLQFQSSYDGTAGGRYFGGVSYRDGHLQYGDYAPIQHDLAAQFDARRGGMTLSNVVLKSGQSQVLLIRLAGQLQQPQDSCPLHGDAGAGAVSAGAEKPIAAERDCFAERHGRLCHGRGTAAARVCLVGRNRQEFATATSHSKSCAPTFAM